MPKQVMNESQLNEQLRSALAGVACRLDTDHVEQRRWRVDAGWLGRDGLGRADQRACIASLPEALQPVAAELSALQIMAWVAKARPQHQIQRAARRRAWQQQA